MSKCFTPKPFVHSIHTCMYTQYIIHVHTIHVMYMYNSVQGIVKNPKIFKVYSYSYITSFPLFHLSHTSITFLNKHGNKSWWPWLQEQAFSKTYMHMSKSQRLRYYNCTQATLDTCYKQNTVQVKTSLMLRTVCNVARSNDSQTQCHNYYH